MEFSWRTWAAIPSGAKKGAAIGAGAALVLGLVATRWIGLGFAWGPAVATITPIVASIAVIGGLLVGLGYGFSKSNFWYGVGGFFLAYIALTAVLWFVAFLLVLAVVPVGSALVGGGVGAASGYLAPQAKVRSNEARLEKERTALRQLEVQGQLNLARKVAAGMTHEHEGPLARNILAREPLATDVAAASQALQEVQPLLDHERTRQAMRSWAEQRFTGDEPLATVLVRDLDAVDAKVLGDRFAQLHDVTNRRDAELKAFVAQAEDVDDAAARDIVHALPVTSTFARVEQARAALKDVVAAKNAREKSEFERTRDRVRAYASSELGYTKTEASNMVASLADLRSALALETKLKKDGDERDSELQALKLRSRQMVSGEAADDVARILGNLGPKPTPEEVADARRRVDERLARGGR